MRFPSCLSMVIVLSVPLFCQADTANKSTTSLQVELPDDVKIASASAIFADSKAPITGKVVGRTVRFEPVPVGTVCDISIVQANGVTLQGVNLNWHDATPVAKDTDPLSPADRNEIQHLVSDIQDFHNRKDVLFVNGTTDRATVLLRLIRDIEFFAGKGQIIWRLETWYFENQAGGWAIVGQQNKVVRRQRFKSADEYKAALFNLRFVPALGGIQVGKQETKVVSKKASLDAAFAAYVEPQKATPTTVESK